MRNALLTIVTLLLLITTLNAQEFELDPVHTFIQFKVERFGAVDVMGRFNEFNGLVSYDADQDMLKSAEVTIIVKSIDTGHDVRDGHLTGQIWLDEASYPTIHFQSNQFEKHGSEFIATGNLTIHGVTNEIELPFTMTAPGKDPTGATTVGFASEITINRQDYGIKFSKLMDNGKLFIGNDVSISINALAQAK